MFSKYLIQFSVDGWKYVPSLLFTWGQTMVEEMKIMVQFSSVQSLSCSTLCDPMNHSTPGLPVHHRESTQTHAH